MSKEPVTYHLKVRQYATSSPLSFVSIWLIRREGAMTSCLMWGEVHPLVVDEVAQATGLAVEREESPLVVTGPVCDPRSETTPVGEQQSLFD